MMEGILSTNQASSNFCITSPNLIHALKTPFHKFYVNIHIEYTDTSLCHDIDVLPVTIQHEATVCNWAAVRDGKLFI